MPDDITIVDDVTLDEVDEDIQIEPAEIEKIDQPATELSVEDLVGNGGVIKDETQKDVKNDEQKEEKKVGEKQGQQEEKKEKQEEPKIVSDATQQNVANGSNVPGAVNGLPKVQPIKVQPPVTTKPVMNRPIMRATMPQPPANQYTVRKPLPDSSRIVPITGVLDMSREGHGVIRVGYSEDDNDAFISTSLVRRYGLLQGDIVTGMAREPKENDRYYGLTQIDKINDYTPEEWSKKTRNKFHRLTPVYPDSKIQLEVGAEPLSLRIIDLIAPIGKGQRSLIVSPPKAGKTVLLKDIASGVATNHPEIHIMAVLVGERPEEVTDIRRHIATLTKGRGEVAASNFDEPAKDQCRVAELALERAKRLVEVGEDVLILLDSITRLARAYNLAMPTSGRTLSGGFDPAALFPPKRFFGAARNFEVQGSLTIIGTALVETGSRMDDLIYEEFKGTGNQEVHLVRRLAERRIYPAIEVQKSGTRRDDLLMDGVTYQSIITLQRMLDMIDPNDRTVTLIEQLKKSKNNKEFLASLKSG